MLQLFTTNVIRHLKCYVFTSNVKIIRDTKCEIFFLCVCVGGLKPVKIISLIMS